MALPSNVGKGTVTGRFIDAFGANIAGTITFTPSPRRLLNATAAPSPVTILPKPITVALVDGTFIQQLVATDDPDNNPQDWTYAVSFNLTDAKADSFSIEVREGQTVDLTTVTPVATGNGTMIVRGAGVPDVEGVENGRVLILVDGEPQWGAAPGGVSSWNDLADRPSTFAPSAHAHDASSLTGTLGVATLAPGSVIRVFYTGSAWPARPTARGDVSVEWIDLTGSASSTTMPTGFNESVDTFWQTANV